MPRTVKPDAIALLKADHRKVETLFEKYHKAGDAERKRALAEEICTELKVHALIEEEIFYPACRGQVEDIMVDEALVEHDEAKILINEIEAGSPDDDFYDAKVKVLCELIEHHVEDEEKRVEGLFSKARKAGLDMEALADRMRARKAELMDKARQGGLARAKTSTLEHAQA